MKHLLVSILFVVLSACSSLGVDPPATFNQRVAAAQISTTAVRTSATTLVNAGKLSAADAKNVQATADAANAAIDLAMRAHAVDPSAADAKLTAAITILSGVQAYLATKGATQ